MRGAVGRGIAVLPPRGLSPVRFFGHYAVALLETDKRKFHYLTRSYSALPVLS